MSAHRFQEIEHKFVLGDDFELADFRATVRALAPTGTTALAVRDVYYLLANRPGHIYRHRYDREIQHLTVKSLETDAQVRVEVNLDLGQHRGDQQQVVDAFLETLEVAWRGVVHKEIEVFYFPACEIVYFEATAGSESVRCVEFEALDKTSIERALEILRRYEKLTGFDCKTRTKKAVVELLFPSLADRFRPSGGSS